MDEGWTWGPERDEKKMTSPLPDFPTTNSLKVKKTTTGAWFWRPSSLSLLWGYSIEKVPVTGDAE